MVIFTYFSTLYKNCAGLLIEPLKSLGAVYDWQNGTEIHYEGLCPAQTMHKQTDSSNIAASDRVLKLYGLDSLELNSLFKLINRYIEK